jgi:HK97 family phage portal protein
MIGPIRRLTSMLFSRSTWNFWSLGRHRFGYEREAGDPMDSSIVGATVTWFAKNFPEAPPALWDATGAQEEQIRDHPMLRLLQRPNEHYTGPILWWATTVDWLANGEGYWIVIPSRAGTPVELWWTPSWTMQPMPDPNDPNSYIAYYQYEVDGQQTKLDPRYVVHFRYGLDPHNLRRGASPLKSVLREIFTDNEAVDFTASLLRNMGVPGLLVSPDSGVSISDAEAEEAKEFLREQFTGERRGEPLVQTAPTKIQEFGFSPEQLLLRDLRRIPEERISAVLGIPAVVVGLGAGLERSTFTNMAEAREAAYESGLIPAQKILGEDIRFQLLPLFGDDPFAFRFGFDLSKVRVLQEDLYRQTQRHDLAIRGGWETVAEGRRAANLEVDDHDKVYLRDTRLTEVPQGGGDARPLRPYTGTDQPVPDPTQNGHAADIADEVVRALDRRELTKR